MASRRSAMALEQHGVADALGEISSHHMLKDGVPATGSEVSGQLSSRVLLLTQVTTIPAPAQAHPGCDMLAIGRVEIDNLLGC